MKKILVLILTVLLLQACDSSENFDERAISAYNLIEDYFINSVPINDWNTEMTDWIYENMREMEKNPEKYGEKESIVFENLSEMMVSASIMNGLGYRNRTIEEEYYDSRDTIKPYLGID